MLGLKCLIDAQVEMWSELSSCEVRLSDYEAQQKGLKSEYSWHLKPEWDNITWGQNEENEAWEEG